MKQFESKEALRRWLLAQGIDLERWGRGAAKTVADLWAEIRQGESQIEEDPPRRRVEVVRVIVRRGDEVLIEAHQDFHGGRQRSRGRPPSEKMKPGESYKEAALRCVAEELGVGRDRVQVLPETYRRKVRQEESGSYPGLCTHYTFHVVRAEVRGLPPNDFSTTEGAGGPGEPVHKHYWVWREGHTG